MELICESHDAPERDVVYRRRVFDIATDSPAWSWERSAEAGATSWSSGARLPARVTVSARLRRSHALGLSCATPDATRRAASRDRRPRRRAHVRRRAVLLDAPIADHLERHGGRGTSSRSGRPWRPTRAAPSSGVSSTGATRSATTRGRTPTSRPSTSRRFTRRCAGRPRRSPGRRPTPPLARAVLPLRRPGAGRGREPGRLRGVVLVDARRLGAPGRGDGPARPRRPRSRRHRRPPRRSPGAGASRAVRGRRGGDRRRRRACPGTDDPPRLRAVTISELVASR